MNIDEIELVNPIKEKFNTKVLLRNDAKCAALAEKKLGSIKKYDDVCFLTIGTGIGGAVFMEGKMLSPKVRSGFEIGHMVIDKSGKKCTCGKNGCFEALASMGRFKKEVKERLNLPSNITGKEIREVLEEKSNYEKTEDIIDKYINNLSIGLINLVEIFEPEVLAIGGGFVHYKKILMNKLNEKMKNYPKIILAELENDAGIIGSVIE